MSRWLRFLALVLAGAAACVFAVFTGIDHSGPVGTAYANAAARAIAAVHPQPRSGPLLAGFGRARLTPELGVEPAEPGRGAFASLPLAGYGGRRGAAAEGVHDELYAKAVVFEVDGLRTAILSLDALFATDSVADAISHAAQAEFGISRDALVIGATHTHSGLGGYASRAVEQFVFGAAVEGAREWVVQQSVEALRAASADLAPAGLAHAAFEQPEFVKSRIGARDDVLDGDLSLSLVGREDGRRALVVSYSAHATVLGAENRLLSGDYPGALQRALEADPRIDLALFLAGAVGGQADRVALRGFEAVEKMGASLASAALERIDALERELTREVELSSLGVQIELPPAQARVGTRLRLRPWLARVWLPIPKTIRLQALRIGNRLWLPTPADFSGELAASIRRQLEVRRGLHVDVTSFSGGYIGYVVPRQYWYDDGYEMRTMNFFGPALAEHLSTSLVALAGRTLTAE